MSCDRQADAVVGQRNEELRETFHNVRHLDPHRHRALAQVKLLYAVREEILVSARELGLSSRHLRDVSDKKGDVLGERLCHCLVDLKKCAKTSSQTHRPLDKREFHIMRTVILGLRFTVH